MLAPRLTEERGNEGRKGGGISILIIERIRRAKKEDISTILRRKKSQHQNGWRNQGRKKIGG